MKIFFLKLLEVGYNKSENKNIYPKAELWKQYIEDELRGINLDPAEKRD